MILDKAKENPFVTSMILFVVWLLILVGGSHLFSHGGTQSLDETVSRGVSVWNVLPPAFLLIAVAVLGWRREVGLKGVESARSLLILWLPLLIVVGILSVAAAYIDSFTRVMAFIIINTILVGISEELMFRGVVFYGALSQFRVWPAILFTSVLFGSVHILNGFTTGDFASAAIQAVAATMGGIWFTAVRLRTKSIFPGMAIHGIWDCVLLISITAVKASLPDQPLAARPGAPSASSYIMPVLFELPLFLYGLWYLRGVGKKDKGELLF